MLHEENASYLPTVAPKMKKVNARRKAVNLKLSSDDSIDCRDTIVSVASIKGITNCNTRKGTQQKSVRAIDGVLREDQGVITPVILSEKPNDLVYRPDSTNLILLK